MGKIKDILDNTLNKYNEIEEKFSEEDAHILDMRRSIQTDFYSCGVQATFSILDYYGKARSVRRVADQLEVDGSYPSETAIYRLFRAKKLKIARRRNATLNTIKEAIDKFRAPVITTIDNGAHWIVVYGYSKTKYYILDSIPFRPSVKWSKKKFMVRWDYDCAIIYRK